MEQFCVVLVCGGINLYSAGLCDGALEGGAFCAENFQNINLFPNLLTQIALILSICMRNIVYQHCPC